MDFLREALAVLVEGIMDAEVSLKVGAGYGERSPDLLTQHNGYLSRTWDTRVGTMELRIPIEKIKAADMLNPKGRIP